MKRFRFRLERLSRLAEAERRLLGGELAVARRAQAQAEAEAARERDILADASLEWRQRADRGEPVELLRAANAWRWRIAREVEAADAAVEEQAAIVAGRREEWLAARRRTEMFERLEERQRERHDAELQKTDQAAIDEQAAGHLKGGENR